MVTLARLVADIGSTLCSVQLAPLGEDVHVSNVVIHDPFDQMDLGSGRLVIGVGLDVGDALRLIETMGAVGATAIMIKPPLALDASIGQAAQRSGVAVVSLAPSASWSQVIGLARSVVTTEDFGVRGEQPSGVATGDLYALANAIATAVGGPVTIEDRQSRLLAYSSNQEGGDDGRRATILSRQVPADIIDDLRAKGVFRRLVESHGSEYIELPGLLPRAAMAVRAGDEVLGSVWAVVPGPLSPERERAFVDCASIVALHLLRQRAGADVERRLRADLLATVLWGRGDARDAAARLGLKGEAFRVIATSADPVAGDTELWRSRLWDALALHVSAWSVRCATALVGGVAYAVVPTSTDDAESREQAMRIARTFLERSGLRIDVTVGVSALARGLSGIVAAREQADQVLRVLGTIDRGVPLAEFHEIQMRSLLLRLADLVETRESLETGGLRVLQKHDERHHTDYFPTLRSYLDAFGDASAAAKALKIHPNTLRYRIAKLQEISGISLSDPAQRLDLLLQLRLLDLVQR